MQSKRKKGSSEQAVLPGLSSSKKLSFGGSQLKSNPKFARPIAIKQAMHVVMRSTHARGQRSFLLHSKAIENILKKQALACGVNLYDFANAGNHLHLVIRVPSRRLYLRFIRASSGLIARRVMGRERGKAQLNSEAQKLTLAKGLLRSGTFSSKGVRPLLKKRGRTPFWDARPFTRIVAWGTSYKVLKNYLLLNRVETLGLDRLSAREMLAKIEALKKSSNLHPFGFV